MIVWTFGFGQHQSKDHSNCFRPIFRLASPDWKPDYSQVMVPSVRQQMGDKRVRNKENYKGKIPSDVWEFSRIQGNNGERRSWHPTQHPEALMERIVKISGGPVVDLFLGSGTTGIVCERLGVDWVGVEMDPEYCRQAEEEIKRVV